MPDKPLQHAPYNKPPDGKFRGILLFLHGCNGFRSHYKLYPWAKLYAAMGLRVMVPDSFYDPRPIQQCGRGSLESQSDKNTVGRLRIAQTQRTIKELRKKYPTLPLFIWGHSEGGVIAQWLNSKVEGIITSGAECGSEYTGSLLVRKSVPLLVMIGVDDPYIYVRGGRTYKNLRKHCRKTLRSKKWRFVVMKGQKHDLSIDHAVAVKEVKHFINSNLARWEKKRK